MDERILDKSPLERLGAEQEGEGEPMSSSFVARN